MLEVVCEKNQIENLVLKINQFINEHLKKYNNFIKKIICKKRFDDLTLQDIMNCSFNSYFELIRDIYPNIKYYSLEETHALFHSFLREVIEKYINNDEISEDLFDNLYLEHIKLIKKFNNIIFQLEFAKNQIDGLTKVWKREIFLKILEKEFSKFKRGGKGFCLVYFDIDYFKTINDSYSHYIGDVILNELILLIKKSLREYDSIARWGGDEFLILLPETNILESFLIISRVKTNINNKIFHIDSMDLKLTCSFGIVESSMNTTIDSLIKQADNLLYKAKTLGRDRIEILD